MATGDYQEDGVPTIGADEPTSITTAKVDAGQYIGAVFNARYRIEKELGRGGIGLVFLAHDQQLHAKPVVIKVLLEEAGQDVWFKKKFRQEAEALARIDHPGIVSGLDEGQTPDGKPFLVMQYVKGHVLRSLIKPEGMDFDAVARIVRQAGQALSAAHDQGILHCDLKPENIMLQDLGEGDYQVKLVDFGIAKIRDSQVTTSSTDTKVAGTIPYMAPEQILGQPAAATDIFALGVIAYEMLTGRRPFNHTSQYQVMETLRAGVRVKPQDLRPNLPTVAQEIILKALAFDADERYERARDFGELLAQALTTNLELPKRAAADVDTDIEMAHVLFMDIVGYSKLATDEQTRIVKQLQQIVTGTAAFQRAKTSKQLISRSTGDGMALVFFSGPKAPTECAMEIARELKSQPHIGLRQGINSGPVYRVKDLNETLDVAGAGINMAQRVMDCGDAGHILLAKSVADVLSELGEWRNRIHDLGERKVKHGARVHLYNLHFGEMGNPRLPAKISQQRKSRVAAVVVGLVILLVAAIAVWLNSAGKAPGNNPASNANTGGVTSAEIDRMLSYSLTVAPHINDRTPPRLMTGPEGVNFKGFDVKLNISAVQPGYLYVLNQLSDSPSYQVLYPILTDKPPGRVSTVKIPENEDHWIPSLEAGTRRLWLVWSDSQVDELKPVKSQAQAADGQVKDPARNKAIYDMLMKYKTEKTHTPIDGTKTQTDVMGKGSTLAYELTFQYQ